MAPTQVRQIRVFVDTKGNKDLQEISKSLGGLSSEVKKLSGFAGLVKTALNFSFLGFGIKQITDISDSMELLSGRLRILTGSAEGGKSALEAITGIADRTKSSIDGTGKVFTKFGFALQDTGITTRKLGDLVELLQNSFRVSGASSEEASSAVLQLGQSFTKGKLDGDEFRTVMESNVVVAQILRKEYGKDIFEKAKSGAITTQAVLRLLFKNQEAISEQTKQLGQTFAQTFIVIGNEAKIRLAELNEQMGISAKFANVASIAIANFDRIILALAITSLPAIYAGLKGLGVLLISNPIGLLFAAIGVAAALLFDNFAQLSVGVKRLTAVFIDLFANMAKGFEEFNANDPTLSLLPKKLEAVGEGAKKTSDKLKEFAAALRQSALESQSSSYGLTITVAETKKFLEDEAKEKRFEKWLASVTGPAKKVKEMFAELNTAYFQGKITVEEYFNQVRKLELLKIEDKFKTGAIELDKYNEKLIENKRINIDRDFVNNRISLQEYNKEIEANKIAELNNKLASAKITLQQFHAEVLKVSSSLEIGGVFRGGLEAYFDSLGTAASIISTSVGKTFGSLEDALVEFTKKGSQDFKEFAQSVLDDLNRVLIRALIIRPIVEGILGFLGPKPANGAGSSTSSYSGGGVSAVAAKGMAFDSGVNYFAKGGLVSGPTLFGYGNGKVGMAGEAGTEAILPLQRGDGGNLGVAATVSPVYVNIINQAGASVEQRETSGPAGERMIEIMILNKVREGFSKGSFDGELKSGYGIRRKGL